MAKPRRHQFLTPRGGACGRQDAARLSFGEERSFYMGKLAARRYFLRYELPKFTQPLPPTSTWMLRGTAGLRLIRPAFSNPTTIQ